MKSLLFFEGLNSAVKLRNILSRVQILPEIPKEHLRIHRRFSSFEYTPILFNLITELIRHEIHESCELPTLKM